MQTTIMENPITDITTENDEPDTAHIIAKEDQMRGYVLGEAVLALCGYVFVPTRDPKNYPMCEACKEEVQRIISGG